ncbi:hypothetical protein ACTXT7_017634, partial [Hymenolepis weldensis]
MSFPVLAFATPNEAKTLLPPKCPISFCGVHNATKADQGSPTCFRAFWKVRCITDRVASRCGVRAEASPANQRS